MLEAYQLPEYALARIIHEQGNLIHKVPVEKKLPLSCPKHRTSERKRASAKNSNSVPRNSASKFRFHSSIKGFFNYFQARC
jgi:hypothetical protein